MNQKNIRPVTVTNSKGTVFQRNQVINDDSANSHVNTPDERAVRMPVSHRSFVIPASAIDTHRPAVITRREYLARLSGFYAVNIQFRESGEYCISADSTARSSRFLKEVQNGEIANAYGLITEQDALLRRIPMNRLEYLERQYAVKTSKGDVEANIKDSELDHDAIMDRYDLTINGDNIRGEYGVVMRMLNDLMD